MQDLSFAQAQSALSPNFYLKNSFYNVKKQNHFHSVATGHIHYTASSNPANVVHIFSRKRNSHTLKVELIITKDKALCLCVF